MSTPTIRRGRLTLVLAVAAVVAVATTTLVRGPAEAVEGPVEVVFVTNGQTFPDALAGATLAGAVGAPLLMVKPEPPLPSETTAALAALDPDRIVILGGPLAVSEGTRDALIPYAQTGTVTRIEGDSRYGTAAAIADALPDKVHEADLLDGFEGEALLTHWINWTFDRVRSHSPGLEGVSVERPGGVPSGTYCIHLPEGVSRPEVAVASVQDAVGGDQDYGIAVTTTRGHSCNNTGSWDIAVDITRDGAPDDSDFLLMFPAGSGVHP